MPPGLGARSVSLGVSWASHRAAWGDRSVPGPSASAIKSQIELRPRAVHGRPVRSRACQAAALGALAAGCALANTPAVGDLAKTLGMTQEMDAPRVCASGREGLCYLPGGRVGSACAAWALLWQGHTPCPSLLPPDLSARARGTARRSGRQPARLCWGWQAVAVSYPILGAGVAAEAVTACQVNVGATPWPGAWLLPPLFALPAPWCACQSRGRPCVGGLGGDPKIGRVNQADAHRRPGLPPSGNHLG
jgi:hypothetical protein